MRKWIRLNKEDSRNIFWEFTNYPKIRHSSDTDTFFDGFWLVTFTNRKTSSNYPRVVFYHWSCWDIWYNPFSSSFRLYLNLRTRHKTAKCLSFVKIDIDRRFFDYYNIDRIVMNKSIELTVNDIFNEV